MPRAGVIYPERALFRKILNKIFKNHRKLQFSNKVLQKRMGYTRTQLKLTHTIKNEVTKSALA